MVAAERRDLFEVIEERHGISSTIVATQLPVNLWHENIRDPTIADAILDRIVHSAYRIELKGEFIHSGRVYPNRVLLTTNLAANRLPVNLNDLAALVP